MVLNALHGDPLPVYGDGMQVRNWLYVEDFGRGIGHVLAHGAPGEVYNVGGPDECPNIEVVKRIVELTGADESLIEYVTDRPGHDRRYSPRLREGPRAGLGGAGALRGGPASGPCDWYRDNAWWWEPIRSGDYREYYERQYGRTLGLSSAGLHGADRHEPPRLAVLAEAAACRSASSPLERRLDARGGGVRR